MVARLKVITKCRTALLFLDPLNEPNRSDHEAFHRGSVSLTTH